MNLSEIPPVIREALCIFSALRGLDFPSDDINIIFQQLKDGSHDVHVQLSKNYPSKLKPKALIAFRAGTIEGDTREHHDVLIRFCGLPDELRESIIERLYPESNVGSNHLKLLTSLMSHGVMPWMEKKS